MNNKIILLTKLIILPIILVSFSCSKRNYDKIEILSFKNSDINYRVFQNYSNVNSDNIEQCEKFLEHKNTPNGFEIYGASIADLYSIFYGVERNNINLKDKKALFYSIIYIGPPSVDVNIDILEKLIHKRNLKVSKQINRIEVNILSPEKSKKIDSYINLNNIEESRVLLTDNEYQLDNVNFLLLTQTLNELYPNSFTYEGKGEKKYDLVIPLGKSKISIIDYMKQKYDIDFTKGNKNIESYEIESK